MEAFSIENLSFSYNKSDKKALNNINLKINSGELLLIIGQSGCGKTTLLRMLKKELTPFGDVSGEIFYKGKKLEALSDRESASEIGFIMQDPDSQLVTDKVYSELSFGLENLGYNRELIRSKVAEFASCFGFSDLIERDVNSLSGGEKQLLNLASVMTMNPEVVILDEPVSMLDPIFSGEFLNMLKRINEDFGTTVIIAEHHLQELFKLADKVAYLENGEIKAYNSPKEICAGLKGKNIERTLPVPSRAFNAIGSDTECPITVKEGRAMLSRLNVKNKLLYDEVKNNYEILSCKNIWFRYEKKEADVLKNCCLSIKQGEIYALLGENGSGKSTLLNVLNGSLKPYMGKIKGSKAVGYLPQNPKNIFVKDTLKEDFELVSNSYLELLENFSLVEYLNAHPYDLSGGELQRAAVLKVLLKEPEILLLDEPTKGLDTFSKEKLGAFMRALSERGIAVVIVTHDVEFAAEFADRCGLLFNGEITSECPSREFFSSNTFFTTSAAKMSKGILDGAVTVEDIIRCVNG